MELWTQAKDILVDPTVGRLLLVLVGMVAIYGARRLLSRALVRRMSDTTARYRARKLVGLASWLAVLLFAAAVFSDHLGGLGVAFGVAGAGLAFALQEVISSIAGWLAITFAGFYKIGDRVLLGGIRGDVIDIGVLRTTLFEIGDWVRGDLYNGRVVRVANSFVFKEPVFNYSADFPFLWDGIVVPVRHGSDWALARRILEEVAEELTGEYARGVESTWAKMTRNYVIEAARVEPMVTMIADTTAMNYTVRYVVDFKKRRAVEDTIFERILARFEQTDRVGLASAAQEITLTHPSAVKIHLADAEKLAPR